MESSIDILNRVHEWLGMKCSGHCLQLCVNARLSISTIDCLTGAASKLLGHFKHSVVASKELKKRQRQMEQPEYKLIQSCTTRWISMYYMLKSLVESRCPGEAVHKQYINSTT